MEDPVICNWKSAIQLFNSLVLILTVAGTLHGQQQSKPQADSLESVKITVSLASGGRRTADPMVRFRSDGTIESVPEGTTLTVGLNGVLNGTLTTESLTGK